MLRQFQNRIAAAPINEDYLREHVPSIFSNDVSEKVSSRYTQVSTWQVLQALNKEGYIPVKAMQCRSRLPSKRDHTKHMIRFRHADSIADSSGLFPELVLVNSHDGLSSYRLMAGLYRMVCSNGMIAGDTYAEIKVRHQGDIVGQIIEGTYSVVDDGQKMLSVAHEMESINLNNDEKHLFARALHQVRFPNEGQKDKDGVIQLSGIEPMKLLQPKRWNERDKNDLWTVFNAGQENILKGGVRGMVRDANNRLRQVTTRAVNSIDKNTTLNRALWTLAEEMKRLKSA